MLKRIGLLCFASLVLATAIVAPLEQGFAQTAPATINVPAGNVGGTTITTTAPVNATTSIDVGTYAGQALLWVASVFGTTIGGAFTALLLRWLKNAGIQGTELLRDRLQEVIVNGLNAAAKAGADQLRGRAQVEIKNQVVAQAVEYTQAHAADTLKALGIDPTSQKAVEAIKARIETAINDPLQATPPMLATPVAPAARA